MAELKFKRLKRQGTRKIQNVLKGGEDFLKTVRLMLNDWSDAEFNDWEPNMQQPSRQNEELQPTLDQTDELRVRFYNEREGQRVEIQQNEVNSRVSGLPVPEGPSELHTDNRCNTSENPISARNDTSFSRLDDYISVSQCYFVKYVIYNGYLLTIAECFVMFRCLSQTIFQQPRTNLNFAFHCRIRINIDITQTVNTSSVRPSIHSPVRDDGDPFCTSPAYPSEISSDQSKLCLSDKQGTPVETSARSDIVNDAICRLEPENILQTVHSQVAEADLSGLTPELRNVSQSSTLFTTPVTLSGAVFESSTAMATFRNESIHGRFSHPINIAIQQTADTSSVLSTDHSSVCNVGDLFCTSTVNYSGICIDQSKLCLSDKLETSVETSARSDIVNSPICRLQVENILQIFRTKVTEADRSGLPKELRNVSQSSTLFATPVTLSSAILTTRSAMGLCGFTSTHRRLSHQSNTEYKQTVNISSVYSVAASSVPNDDDPFYTQTSKPVHFLSDKRETQYETSVPDRMNVAISRIHDEIKSKHEGCHVPNDGAVSGRRQSPFSTSTSDTSLINTSFSKPKMSIKAASLEQKVDSKYSIEFEKAINILEIQLYDDPNEEIMSVESSSSNDLKVLEGDAVDGRRISDFDCVDGKRRRIHFIMSKIVETIKVMKFDAIEHDKIAQLQEERLKCITRNRHETGTDTTFVLGFKSEDSHIMFQEDLNEAKESKDKTKPKYCFRLAVVTAEVFEEAMRQCQIFEYDLAYSNYFPRDCKMIIGIPVYKGGFINRRDNKDRGIT